MTKLTTWLTDLLFPVLCLNCGQPGRFICANCANQLKRATPAIGCLSLLDYHDPAVANLLIAGKYKFLSGIYRELGDLLAAHILNRAKPEQWNDFIICPIPLAPRRERWRGFNQAEILGKRLSSALGLPQKKLLRRAKNVKVQKDLDLEQ